MTGVEGRRFLFLSISFLFSLLCTCKTSFVSLNGREMFSMYAPNVPQNKNSTDLQDTTKYVKDNARAFELKKRVQLGHLTDLHLNGSLYTDLENPFCISHLQAFFDEYASFSVRGSKLQLPATWALQMLDSWGGLPDGILSGHLTSPGDFLECLGIRGINVNGSSFRGRYCTTYMIPSLPPLKVIEWFGEQKDNMNSRQAVSIEELLTLMENPYGVVIVPLVGFCLPSTCNMADAQLVLENAMAGTIFSPTVIYATTDEPKMLDNRDIAMIVALCVIGGLCTLGTGIDLIYLYRGKSASQIQKNGVKAIMAFSLYTNTMKMVNTSSTGDTFTCLHGMRFLGMAWVVLGHTFMMVGYGFTWNLVDLKKMYDASWTTLIILNGSLSVDTFFTMAGTLASFNILKALDKSKGRINVPLLYLHRYIRLTPTYIILIGIMASLYRHVVPNSPNGHMVQTGSDNCARNWWHNVLYITNLIKYKAPDGVCLGESWYLSNDFQFFLLAPLICYSIWRWRKIGLMLLACLSLVSIVSPAVITKVKDLPPTDTVFTNIKTLEKDMYHPPWTRIGPYLVGIFLGYILHVQGKHEESFKGHKMSRWVVLGGWTVATGSALAIIFGVESYYHPYPKETDTREALGIVYAGVHRFIWGVVIAWIIYACVKGHGGWINRFLSWTPFIPLGRLTYCMYISSLHIQMILHLTTMHPWHYSSYIYVNLFFAHLVMSMLVSYVLTISLETPFMILEKLVFPTPQRPNTPIAQQIQQTNEVEVADIVKGKVSIRDNILNE